jgi:hypothetical protein
MALCCPGTSAWPRPGGSAPRDTTGRPRRPATTTREPTDVTPRHRQQQLITTPLPRTRVPRPQPLEPSPEYPAPSTQPRAPSAQAQAPSAQPRAPSNVRGDRLPRNWGATCGRWPQVDASDASSGPFWVHIPENDALRASSGPIWVHIPENDALRASSGPFWVHIPENDALRASFGVSSPGLHHSAPQPAAGRRDCCTPRRATARRCRARRSDPQPREPSAQARAPSPEYPAPSAQRPAPSTENPAPSPERPRTSEVTAYPGTGARLADGGTS